MDRRSIARLALISATAITLSGCNMMQRLSEVGEPPKISAIQNPAEAPGYRHVSMPMPIPTASQPSANSLWRPGARAFFKDQRAAEVGDILTVAVDITDRAQLTNQTTATRDNAESADPFVFMGVEGALARVLPESVNPANLARFGSDSRVSGNGSLKRDETIKVNLAAVITQLLPNGNMVIAGRQEVRVNNELRELTVTGVIRPEDITSNNIISSEKIAEARISYGGRGALTDVQQARYGQQLFDILFPF